MSLFNWFYAKPATVSSKGAAEGGQALKQGVLPVAAAVRPPAESSERSEERKVKRHARREQLYAAVRDAMTYSGVLSASYKFKVLSLDQVGDQFLVMMDIDQTVDADGGNLNAIEAKILQSAKARFEITVSAVYWRVNAQAALLQPKMASPIEATRAASPQPIPEPGALNPVRSAPVAPPSRKPPAPRYEPIQDDEVAAFKQALAAASANAPSANRSPSKTRIGPRSYTLITGFEDTEMPESSAAPVLSNTQYGDLN